MGFSRTISVVTALLWLCVNAHGQSYNFKNYNTDQGLAQSQVLCIFQDSRGYMWFGTNTGGASKFDGHKFITVSKNQGLIDDNVYSITENNKHEILFGTSKGLSVYNNFNFKNYDEKAGLLNSWIYKLLDDGNKTWIGTQKGVFIYEAGAIKTFFKDSVLNASSVWTIFKDREENLWFATHQSGVVFYNRKTETFKHFTQLEGLTNNYVFSLGQMDDGTILVGTQTGLNKISRDYKVSHADEIKTGINILFGSILNNGNGEFYFSTFSEGVLNYNFKNHTLKAFNSRNGLTNNNILPLFKDKEGNLWIGTLGDGVYKYHDNKFVYYTKANGLSGSYVDFVSEDSKGDLWLSIGGQGVSKISGKTVTDYKTRPGLANSLTDNTVKTILKGENGKVYFGTEEGLCVYENEKFTVIRNEVFDKKYIQSLFMASDKRIWIGTNEGVYSMLNNEIREEKIINAYREKGLEFLIIFMCEDKDKNIIVGLENGILKFDGKKVIAYNEKNGFVKSRVASGILDARQNLWFGTADGLYFYDNHTFKKINRPDSSNFGFITFLQPDNNNRLLIGTNNEIDILDLTDFYNNKLNLKHLGKEDGLLSKESNFNASTLDKDGRILVGTANGLEVYDPKSDIPNKIEAQTNLTGIKLFFGLENIMTYCEGIDSLTLLPRKLVLPHNQNNLTFQFTGISLVAPEKVMYQYRMEGLEKEWEPPTSNTEAVYSSLPPGKYTFMVKAMNNDGLWNAKPVTYSFVVLPPWYKTWWFYTLCVIALISGVMAYNYIHTRKLKADKQKLEQEVSERTKELREEKEKVESINIEVTAQKMLIEHHSKEITDSIRYAKNIQEALLPNLNEVNELFKNCFVLYMPKDIVSGDFYWFTSIDNKRLIAAADCTGHGVPGAFMSIVGNTVLSEVVNDKQLNRPGDILLELHKGVKIALNKNVKEFERRDGMDIALCAIDYEEGVVEYAGANRPLWIYRQRTKELEIIKATKLPIGGLEMDETRTYTNHIFKLEKGDGLYLFSDGYADQFGGDRGKKFMLSNLQKLILEIAEEPLETQQGKLASAFNNWKGETEQIDDVLVIGVRI